MNKRFLRTLAIVSALVWIFGSTLAQAKMEKCGSAMKSMNMQKCGAAMMQKETNQTECNCTMKGMKCGAAMKKAMKKKGKSGMGKCGGSQ